MDIELDNEGDGDKPKKQKTNAAHKNEDLLEVKDNHIYFYSDVTHRSILSLNKSIRELNKELLGVGSKYGTGYPVEILGEWMYKMTTPS